MKKSKSSGEKVELKMRLKKWEAPSLGRVLSMG